ncbi:chitin synthase [Cantharellus anzutake]|uniref:chitin synthase n=1 Tax=Cantharellus anzutake TaxID=1750568 RepID=UPI0019071E09|nr:chitin synthase [Cantharellus anzutake]KAF8324620.1 chitin synthase [Cantharellus anzutake]
MSTTDPTGIIDLTQLVTGTSNRVYPSEDAVVDVLQARFRREMPWTWIRDSTLLSINPFKVLENVNDASKKQYQQLYTDVAPDESAPVLQPHVYELAVRVYLTMRRRRESQSVIFCGITASGKSHNSRLLSAQLLRLSTHSKKDARLAEQIRALETVLESFGHAKTSINPSATRYTRYTEFHYNDKGRIEAAQVLAFAPDKSRLLRLSNDERTFHVFYQLLAGATPDERDAWGLEDPSDYALLSSSGCYRLPSGPFSDDAVNMGDLRASMKALGFKPKHISSIFSLLVVALLLGNLQFIDYNTKEVNYEPARVSNPLILDKVCHLLGVEAEELQEVLTNKTTYIRKEVQMVVLTADPAAAQRDRLVQDLYAILFAFVVETANHRVAPPLSGARSPFGQIILFDQPGFRSRGSIGSIGGPGPLLSAIGHNKYEEFITNFQNEIVQFFVTQSIFDDTTGLNSLVVSDGISLPSIPIMDNSACVELLRGSVTNKGSVPGGILGIIGKAVSTSHHVKSGERRDEELLKDLNSKFSVHSAFGRPNVGSFSSAELFTISHFSGSCTYDIGGFYDRNSDLLDAAFLPLLRSSSDSFISKLFSGPTLSVETHRNDPNIIVQAQVSSRPLRQPTPTAEPVGLSLDPQTIYPVTMQIDAVMVGIMQSIEQTHRWNVICLRPNDSGSPNSFDKRRVKSQLRSYLVSDIVARRSTEYSMHYSFDAFCDRYAYSDTVGQDPLDRILAVLNDYGLVEGPEYVLGHQSVWLSFLAFKSLEDPLRAAEKERRKLARGLAGNLETESVIDGDDISTAGDMDVPNDWKSPLPRNSSSDNLIRTQFSPALTPYGTTNDRGAGPFADPEPSIGWGSEFEKAIGTPRSEAAPLNDSNIGHTKAKAKEATTLEVPTSSARRWWVRWVWLSTFWIPNFCLSRVGRMKRPDVRMAWREKLTICMMIGAFCGLILFYIIVFGMLLCPGQNKVWNTAELGGHDADNNFWVALHGSVYDITKFWRGHSSNDPSVSITQQDMLSLAGLELTQYFPVPLSEGCSAFVTDGVLSLTPANFTPGVPQAIHYSGAQTLYTGTDLSNSKWYTSTFLPTMRQYYKGPFVYSRREVANQANKDGRYWSIWNNEIFDLSDYFNTLTIQNNAAQYKFLNTSLSSIFKQQPGQDVSDSMNRLMASYSDDVKAATYACLKNNFYYGNVDFRDSPRCKVQNYLLIVASGVLCATIGAKFLAALQLSPKRTPELLDKFVICQVPCYTEGEESLRRTIDSLAALKYDDKRKLIFLICDGNIIGSGNDRPTPRIALDILGVDPSLDPEPLLFHSIGEGSRQLNYGKVYSGLYEFEGHVVPYMVVIKVGKPTERSKPGNRGKRDSQILLLQYLNRVHFDSPMNPLELEIYHQMRNVIGIDPAFYEYILMVDADTTVTPDSLNRLVACTADDTQIIAICGETKLDNPEGSWWTMIQVYEYYISHHLSKSFESLFGSVTCLPGCFSLYRIRTSDKGRPLIISNRVIDDYSENIVDTLHKKNLLSLGEDRYLTTIMMTHFPTFKMKFTPDAIAHTVAPDRWDVLLSQRRRWINSTIHNLVELLFIPELCGFCLFSMRFFVFLDLIGTIMLPATAVYLVYLIVEVATKKTAIPIIALVLIGVVYGLQAVIFILKREFMLVGWLIIYIISYPVYSFFLPLYSFWCMDDFSWGNTRVVVGEGNNKKIVIDDDETYDDSMIPLKRFSEYEAEAWETRSHMTEHPRPRSPSNQAASQLRSDRPPRSASPLSFAPSQAADDYYRNTNVLNPNRSNVQSVRAMSQVGGPPRLNMPPIGSGSFGGFGGSQVGSEYGGPVGFQAPVQLPQQTGMSMSMGMPSYTGSMYGMPPIAPRNSVMTNLNMFSGNQGGGSDVNAPGGPRPTSMTLTSLMNPNPFPNGPSQSMNPSDEELLAVLRTYLSTQDLMAVTKKSAREAVAGQFPNADLSSKKEFLNISIDNILSS